tara:strand:+ start:3906 stop:5960 length:2055 start_codon:yes stop_codon:yes gene_type:complete
MNYNKNMAMSMYIDNTKRNSNPINIPSRKPNIWIPNDKIKKCFKCNVEFGLLTRKHHCRICGRIFCSDCSKWNVKKNEFILSTSPPESFFKTLHETVFDKNDLKTCLDCNKQVKITFHCRDLLTLFINLPVTINELLTFRCVNKKWAENINYIISIYRSIQYKLPREKYTNIEKQFLWTHRYEFKGHYNWITKCLTTNNDKSVPELNKLIEYYNNPTSPIYICKSILCNSICKNTCNAENILEMSFYIDLNKYECIEDYIIMLLKQKNDDFYRLLMPWLVELSKKYIKIGQMISIQCAINPELFYSFYFETKYYINTLNKEDNKNLRNMMDTINRCSPPEFINDIRKTEELIKLVNLILQSPESDRKNIVTDWFIQNGDAKLPWFPHYRCINIDVNNIKQINSSTKPYIIPLKVITNYRNVRIKSILVKNEDLRKDKLTMYISKWLKYICNDLLVSTYNILPYTEKYGWIEIIEDAITLYDIKHKKNTTLQNYIMDLNPKRTIEELRNNFINTCVSSCVLCYILGVGDRHTENIIINKYGELVHIDFSYIMGEDPKNIEVEMKITPGMLQMLGGKKSKHFQLFKKLCSHIYKIIRKRSSLWYMLLTFLAFNKPEIYPYYNNYKFIKTYVIKKLIPGEFDEEGSMQIKEIVEKSSNSSMLEQLSDFTHTISNKVKNVSYYLPFSS